MTEKSAQFLTELKSLCRKHHVEISKASRFWIFGPDNDQCERFGVTDHCEYENHDGATRKALADAGIESLLTVLDLSKTPVVALSSAEFKLLRPVGFDPKSGLDNREFHTI